jgi:hypothetical protein
MANRYGEAALMATPVPPLRSHRWCNHSAEHCRSWARPHVELSSHLCRPIALKQSGPTAWAVLREGEDFSNVSRSWTDCQPQPSICSRVVQVYSYQRWLYQNIQPWDSPSSTTAEWHWPEFRVALRSAAVRDSLVHDLKRRLIYKKPTIFFKSECEWAAAATLYPSR